MPSPLESALKNDGPAHLYTDAYYTFMASHVEYLRTARSTQLLELDARTVHANLYNYHGLFTELGIRYEDHQLLMMVNRIKGPLELTDDIRYLLVPDNTVVERLKNIFRTSQV